MLSIRLVYFPRAHLVVQLRLFFYIFIYCICIRVVRRALNLLRASFSQYFSAVNVTRVTFSPIFQYFLTCMPCMAPCAMDSSAMEGAVHSYRDFRVRRSVVHRALNWLVTHSYHIVATMYTSMSMP